MVLCYISVKTVWAQIGVDMSMSPVLGIHRFLYDYCVDERAGAVQYV